MAPNVDNIQYWIRALAERYPRREATSRTYARAARYVASTLERFGYAASRVPVEVPAGVVDGTPVGSGTTVNVVATPPGYAATSPHVVVGAHLDTVPDTPGANDNASGVAILLELARLARARPLRLPVVFVAFGGEERRRRGVVTRSALFGSRAYVASLGARERAAIHAVINLDMVGAGRRVLVVGSANGLVTRTMLTAASRAAIPARRVPSGIFFSDSASFENVGIPVGWLWAGDHPTLHSPRDVASVPQALELHRVATVAWETLRALHL